MNFQSDDIKFRALEAAVYCPPFKEESAIETIEMDEFDVEKAKEGIRKSVALLSYNKKYRPLIVEILDVLDQNKNEFLLDQQRYLSFYWNGILILRININKDVAHDKQLHVSIQKYETGKNERLNDRKMSRFVMMGVGGSFTVAALIGLITIFKSRNGE